MTSTDASALRWGILGTGQIAGAFVKGVLRSERGRLIAVASRTREGIERFAGTCDLSVPHCHASYEALLADPEVEAVYISTPHPQHAEWAIKAAEAKKHVLCEKPIALNHTQASAIVEAARRNGVFLMEAFMYRCHPQTARLVKLLRSGAIGAIRVVQAAFSFHHPIPFDPRSRLLDHALAGGGILDVGCYSVSMARLAAGAASGTDFAEPTAVWGAAHLGETGVDEWAVASLAFPGGMLAQLACGVQVEQDNSVRIYGSDGWIHVPDPWAPAREGGRCRIFLHRRGQSGPEAVVIESPQFLYAIEADTVADAIAAGRQQAAPPAMTWDDTLGNMRVLDQWRQVIGLRYADE